MERRHHRVVAVAAAVAVVATAVVLSPVPLPLAASNPPLDVALDTVAGGVALLAALLALARLRRRGQRRDALQAAAFLTLGLASLVFSVGPAVIAAPALAVWDVWAVVGVGLVGAALFTASAWTGSAPVGRPEPEVWVTAGVASLVASAAIATVAAQDALPQATGLAPGGEFVPASLVAHPVITATQFAGATLYALAAVGFRRQARAGEGELAAWFGAAAVLAAAARVHSALYPSLESGIVYSGDVLRLGFTLLVLVGATREVVAASRAEARAAVLEERQRLARDLHDGVAQELAFIQAEVGRRRQRAGADVDDERIAGAARRALDESRRVVAALVAPADEPLEAVLSRFAAEVEARTGVRVTVAASTCPALPATVREELVRIAREAVHNAVRHSGSDSVAVRIDAGEALVLGVRDHGRGFDVATAERATGTFGLTSMRERAEALGGALRIRCAPDGGTDVEVRLPLG